MPRMGVYDQVKRAFQDIIAPEIHAFRADLHRLDQKIDHGLAAVEAKVDHGVAAVEARVDHRLAALEGKVDHGLAALAGKIDNLDTRLTVRLDSLRTEMVSMKGELLAEVRRLDVRIAGVDRELQTAIDVRERLAALEARRAP
jgi:hypothetical protein